MSQRGNLKRGREEEKYLHIKIIGLLIIQATAWVPSTYTKSDIVCWLQQPLRYSDGVLSGPHARQRRTGLDNVHYKYLNSISSHQ